MLSFITATYRRPDMLRVLLSSLIAQTSRDWECLVMDEGDNAHIVQQLADERIQRIAVERVEIAEDGRGTIGLLAKDAGVFHAQGDYLCFPSEDVYYFPHFVREMSVHTRIPIVGCDMIINYTHAANCLYFMPKVGFADCANYIIKPEWYKRHRFTDFIPRQMGTADGLLVQKCAEDGAGWARVPKFLVVHGEERP